MLPSHAMVTNAVYDCTLILSSFFEPISWIFHESFKTSTALIVRFGDARRMLRKETLR